VRESGVGAEYFFRHYVLFWWPVFGTLLVNDRLALLPAYSLLAVGVGLGLQVNWRKELAGVVAIAPN